MKKTDKLLNKLLLTLLLFFIPFQVNAESIDPYKNIKFFTLDNGLKVYLLSDEKAINTKVKVIVNAGKESETKENSGITHLVEHLVFRDKRIPHRDYLDYIEEEGATYINGYTRQYTTEYMATIKSDKSEWLVKTFAQMIFDKDIDQEDLEIERRALQVEIGELKGGDYLKKTFQYLGTLYPERENIFVQEFGLEKEKPFISSYYYKTNNQQFQLPELLDYYNDYYYPKNMTLEIAGNFNVDSMIELITSTYGKVQKKGTKTTKKPDKKGSLNHKPHIAYKSDSIEHRAYIGTKHLSHGYKEYLILDIYTQYLATKMQQLLRNKLGQTYSVNHFDFNRQNASVKGIYFETLKDNFEKSIQLVREKIAKDQQKISKEEIEEALKSYALNFESLEHDNRTLSTTIKSLKHQHEKYKLYTQTPYEVFKSITIEEFQNTINKTFIAENEYQFIYKEHYLFSLESLVLTLLTLIVFIFLFKKVMISHYKKIGKTIYTKRDILFSRRLRGMFFVIVQFIFIFIIALFIADWIEFYLYSLIMGNPYYATSVDLPYSRFLELGSFILYLIVFILVKFLILNKVDSRLDVTPNALNFIGGRWEELKKENILNIEIVPWSFNKRKDIKGFSLLFLKPLIKIETDEKVIYLRTNNAVHLKEDLDKWRGQE